jgi:pyruvate/2-oxoglutarate dehydrogenase complex dihydrolipoamide acyltransferase (E2) component
VVAVDAPVAEVETAKATVDVPSPLAGIVAELHGKEGSTIPVGAPLITVTRAEDAARYVEEERAGSATSSSATRPARRRVGGVGSGPRRPHRRPSDREIVSPIVRQLARRAGIDPATLVGTGRDPGLLALLARFVVAGLRAYPALNSRVDIEREEVVHLDGVNLGVAAQTERGLIVPAVRGADRFSIRGLDTEIRRLTVAAREGTATAAELSSGSFTLNNYGVFGVDGSAAIINHPEAAILGIGRIHPRPWVVDGHVVPRQITQLSLVFDHRVCDGGTAAGFLRFVADAVEAPLRTVVDL